jgi:hypothetical protein
MKEELIKRWIELSQIRSWLSDQISAETDRDVQDDLFEARYAIGISLLHLERVDYRLHKFSDSENQMK